MSSGSRLEASDVQQKKRLSECSLAFMRGSYVNSYLSVFSSPPLLQNSVQNMTSVE